MNVHEVETWTFHDGQEASFLAGLPRWFQYVAEHPELFPEWISGALVREIDGFGSPTGRFRMTFAYDSLADLTSYRARRSRPTPEYEEYLTLDVGERHIDPNRLAVEYWQEVRSAVWRDSGATAVDAQDGRHA
jgi:hypothetical protein